MLHSQVVLLGLEYVPSTFDLDLRVSGVVLRDNSGAREIVLPHHLRRIMPEAEGSPTLQEK